MRVSAAFPGEADGVPGEGGQMGDQLLVSADGQLIRGDFRGVFHGRRGGPAGGYYRVFAGWFLIVGESERGERLAQVPAEVGGEHAQDTCARTRFSR